MSFPADLAKQVEKVTGADEAEWMHSILLGLMVTSFDPFDLAHTFGDQAPGHWRANQSALALIDYVIDHMRDRERLLPLFESLRKKFPVNDTDRLFAGFAAMRIEMQQRRCRLENTTR